MTLYGPLSAIVLCAALAAGCGNELPPVAPRQQPEEDLWTIPDELVFASGAGRGSVAELEDPAYVRGWEQTSTFPGASLVSIVKPDDGPARVYPHTVLQWHELVNHANTPEVPWSVTHSPLTGSTVVLDPVAAGMGPGLDHTLFTYNSSLIFRDRAAGDYWCQLLLRSVRGGRAGETFSPFHRVEATLRAARRMFDDPLVLSTDTGFPHDYRRSPYGEYRSSPEVYFPLAAESPRYSRKRRLFGVIINREARLWELAGPSNRPEAINDRVGGLPVVVVRSTVDSLIAGYLGILHDVGELAFEVDTSRADVYPLILKDNLTGSSWNVFGECVSGPLEGRRLPPAPSTTAYWFTWFASYPNLTVYP